MVIVGSFVDSTEFAHAKSEIIKIRATNKKTDKAQQIVCTHPRYTPMMMHAGALSISLSTPLSIATQLIGHRLPFASHLHHYYLYEHHQPSTHYRNCVCSTSLLTLDKTDK